MELPTPDDEFLRWEFQAAGQNALNWYLSAKSLFDAATELYSRYEAARGVWASRFTRDELGIPQAIPKPFTPEEMAQFKHTEFGSVAIMLLGFGLENLGKALLIRANPSLVSGTDGIRQIKTHRLENLLPQCGYKPTKKDKGVLSILSEYVEWAGRYPIPTKPLKPDRPGASQGLSTLRGSVEWVWSLGRPIFDRLEKKWNADGKPAA